MRETEYELSNRVAFLLVIASCFSTPLSVFVYNREYFTTTTGYADGGDMYSHISEALHVKELLQSKSFDFWFDKVTCGYPMFVAYHPLPTFMTGLFMLMLQIILPPLLLFRLLLMIVLTLMPVAWYYSAREFGLTRLQSTYVSQLVFLCQSWHSFGLEVRALTDYGLYTQAFGMLIFPIAASKIFHAIMWTNSARQKSCCIVLLVLTFLSHFYFGMYVSILSSLAAVLYLAINTSLLGNFKNLLRSFGVIYIASLLLMIWWIFPCLVSMKYVGGLPWRGKNEDGYPFKELAVKFFKGNMFDHGRSVAALTLLVSNGFWIGIYKIFLSCKQGALQSKSSVFTLWILTASVTTFSLLLGRTNIGEFYDCIPFHSELEVIRYLSGCHFCGILHASYSLLLIHTLLCRALSTLSVFLRKQSANIVAVVVGSCLLGVHFQYVGPNFTLTEISTDLSNSLLKLQTHRRDGRILAHKGLGTGWPWDMAFIPHLSKKPGLLTYSRGYHDSLSVFYAESTEFTSANCSSYIQTFQLYNIQFLALSNVDPNELFDQSCQLKEVFAVEGFIVYEVLSLDVEYGYFEFIHVAGHITGDLKLIRESVMSSLEAYKRRALFLINPSPKLLDINSSLVSVNTQLREFPSQPCDSFIKPTAVSEWKVNHLQVSSLEALAYVHEYFANKWIYSQIIEERSFVSKYEAVVQVKSMKGGHKLFNQEFLILKVTYHPFWRCYFSSVDDDYTINRRQGFEVFARLDIHHIAPNFMAVKLPPGRYYLRFVFVLPRIIKILFVMSLLCFIMVASHGLGYSSLFEKSWISRYMCLTAKRVASEGLAMRGEDSKFCPSWGVQGKFSMLNRLAQENFRHSTSPGGDTELHCPISLDMESMNEKMSLEKWLDDYHRNREGMSAENSRISAHIDSALPNGTEETKPKETNVRREEFQPTVDNQSPPSEGRPMNHNASDAVTFAIDQFTGRDIFAGNANEGTESSSECTGSSLECKMCQEEISEKQDTGCAHEGDGPPRRLSQLSNISGCSQTDVPVIKSEQCLSQDSPGFGSEPDQTEVFTRPDRLSATDHRATREPLIPDSPQLFLNSLPVNDSIPTTDREPDLERFLDTLGQGLNRSINYSKSPKSPGRRRWAVGSEHQDKAGSLAVQVSGKVSAMRKKFSMDDKPSQSTEGTFVKVPWSEVNGPDSGDSNLFLIENSATPTEKEVLRPSEDIIRVGSSDESLPRSEVSQSSKSSRGPSRASTDSHQDPSSFLANRRSSKLNPNRFYREKLARNSRSPLSPHLSEEPSGTNIESMEPQPLSHSQNSSDMMSLRHVSDIASLRNIIKGSLTSRSGSGADEGVRRFSPFTNRGDKGERQRPRKRISSRQILNRHLLSLSDSNTFSRERAVQNSSDNETETSLPNSESDGPTNFDTDVRRRSLRERLNRLHKSDGGGGMN